MIRLLVASAAALALAAPAGAATDVLRTVSTVESWAMPVASVRSEPFAEDSPPGTVPAPLRYAEFGYRVRVTQPQQQIRLTAHVSCTRTGGAGEVTRLATRSQTYVATAKAPVATLWLPTSVPAAHACDAFASVLRFVKAPRSGKWVPATRGRMTVTLLARS